MGIQALGTSNAASLKNKSNLPSTGQVSAIAAPLQAADRRIQGEIDKTSALLSTFGRLKSAVSETQIAAKALASPTGAPTAANLKLGIGRLITAFNAAIAASKAAQSTSNLSDAAKANRAALDLTRSISTDTPTVDALKKLGVSLQSNGQLAFDSQKFDSKPSSELLSLNQTLQKLGKNLDKASSKELASDGIVSNSVLGLNQRAKALQAQKNAISQASAALSTNNSSSARYDALAAYRA